MREIYETREEYEMAMRSGIGNNYILPMESNEEVKVLQEKLEISVKENQQLKELLRECRYKIIADLDNARLCESSVDIEDFEYLLNRIDNAIGEK